MKKQLIIYTALLISLLSYSQGQVILSSSYTGGSLTACQSIQLKPGFSYKAVSGQNISLAVSPSSCDPFNGKDIDATSIKAENYIRTKTYLKDDQSRYLDEIQYFDGLGRPIQTVQRGITPGAKDLATFQEYDPVGRESLAWLPGAVDGNNGKYVRQDIVAAKSKETNADPRPYVQPVYEPSPLNRIKEQYGPGDAWKSNPVKTEYLTNDQSTYACLLYTVGGTRTVPTLVKGGNYATGQLYVTKVTDEEQDANIQGISYEFKDKLGQVVMTRQVSDGANHDTYYVYDDYGNLSFVLPPLAAGTAGTETARLNLYAYQYKYNSRNLCISKKLPGCEAVYYIYDKADRLILTQDGEQRAKSQWLFSIPDIFGRTVLSGICKNTFDYTQSPLQTTLVKADWKNTTTAYKGYEISGLTPTNAQLLAVNYYDNYEFVGKNNFPAWTFVSQPGYGTNHSNNKTLLTGTITGLLDGSGKMLCTLMYYDNKGQLIQTRSENHIEGTDAEYIAYNFTGQPTKRLHGHTAKGKPGQTELYTYEYDHAGRLLTTRHQLNTGPTVTLAHNTYDDLGRLISTSTNNQSALKTNYAYNVRSWIRSITNSHFAETLHYRLTGNIHTQQWQQNGKTRTYTFKYDGLSRLKEAQYAGDGNYSTGYTYDKHGNVLTLKRNAASYGLVDNLTFSYDGTGNQLKYITDGGVNVALPTMADFKENSKVTTAEYTYNKNGAMSRDLNKGLTVVYNSLNLPQELLVNNTTARGKNYYTYNATGTKLRVKHLSDPTLQVAPVTGTASDAGYKVQNTTDYVGSKIYENGILNKTLIDNGYIEGNNYYFYIKDHLGNNRIVADASGTVVQRSNYYPFGMSFGEESEAEQGRQNFKYNGKELDKTHGLNQYDYSARYMDPGTIRFTSVDPHAENYFSWSPYAYVGNNPLKFIDPDGRDVWSTNDPEQIAKFFEHLQSIEAKETSDPFNYGDWSRMSDDEYKEYDKTNSVSFNDDKLSFNINLDDYQADFNVSMRGKDSKNAYISLSDLNNLFTTEDKDVDLENNLLGFAVGTTIEGVVGPHLLKNSKLAKMIFPRSARVLGAKAETSILSASMRRIWPKVGGAASKWIGGALSPIGLGLMYYDAWMIGRELGQIYGGDAWVRQYKMNKNKK